MRYPLTKSLSDKQDFVIMKTDTINSLLFLQRFELDLHSNIFLLQTEIRHCFSVTDKYFINSQSPQSSLA